MAPFKVQTDVLDQIRTELDRADLVYGPLLGVSGELDSARGELEAAAAELRRPRAQPSTKLKRSTIRSPRSEDVQPH